MSKLTNFIAFQVCWFACVLGAAKGMEWIGPLSVALFLAWSLTLVASAKRELAALAAAAALGTFVDTVQLQMGWLVYQGAPLLGALAPSWIVALWVVFASTFESSLAWVTSRPWLNVAFALFGAPVSYLGGERLGSLEVLAPRTSALIGVGVLWAVALPLAALVYRRVRS